MGKHEPIEFCCELKYETDKAYCVHDGINEFWIPKSQCQEARQIGGKQSCDWEFTIPEWLAREKGIIFFNLD